MSTGFFKVPKAKNEIVKSYKPGSPERKEVTEAYNKMINNFTEIPMFINGNDVKSGKKNSISPPHDHQKVVGEYYIAEPNHIDEAIQTALNAKNKWENMSWENRSAIFLKAAELIAGPYRSKINAATMIAQSKTVHQAEIDSACELIDFLRFNVEYVTQIYSNQPASDNDAWNRVEYRPLEGFVYAVTPFNFTAIAGNLPTCMAMLGNVVLWKPSSTQIYSAKVIIDVLKEAGIPDGVINVVYGNASLITEKVLSHKEFSGLHFTGSTSVFNSFWKTIGDNIANYNTYPKIVGETGGKDFILAHDSSNRKGLLTSMIRGAFEYQGQKCSAASRCYLPENVWNDIKDNYINDVSTIKVGDVNDFSNFMNAVIDEYS
ncbi:MAG: 1-pyrroline-5-carboxylate dehydrogenase, partial [Flavobacteriales bacterium]|nr:1-pyrroline-5-carboxylate dehydrogenase [Flavobacteriales bacterium]